VAKKSLKIEGILELNGKDYYILRKSVLEEILELIEDIHDIKVARKRKGGPSVSLAELEEILGVQSKGK
jgi:hypothetical protein